MRAAPFDISMPIGNFSAPINWGHAHLVDR